LKSTLDFWPGAGFGENSPGAGLVFARRQAFAGAKNRF